MYNLNAEQNILFVTTDDRVYGLGSNSEGVLGLGHNRPIHTPEEVPQLRHQNIHNDHRIYVWETNCDINNIEMYYTLEMLGSGGFGKV
ncbi:unnamed protein product [Medioppia subpectinata]|uniref:Uncharacterized protein n=1 Tax=Medioppia subpectinata TaxID=1979941 RepID=A0A7R9L8E2_9ACAR|nr:unnamed protein product [Medioppia subpectinata]CAG2116300.1 unnamed protein product [Medioppia subpectinata]